MENVVEKKKIKVAIVHDFLTYFGGAEQVVKSLHNIYPDAPIFTLLYDRKMQKYFPGAKIVPSFLDKFPRFLQKRKKLLLPFFPTAIETFDLGNFDVVISSSSSFAKGLIVRPKTLHIDYCHTPTRFLWDWHMDYLAENKVGNIKKLFVLPVIHFARIWDRLAADRVDFYIANSKSTQRRIKKFYRKESSVIYPPVDFEKFSHFENGKGIDIKDYYLIVSRLSPYKKIDIAIQAFNKMGLPLVIVGEGDDRNRLEKIAEKNIHFAGFQDEEELMSFYQNCKAFIFPGEDDFGISAVEAMSFGKPVLAFKKGGALETVVEGVTGEFFESPVAEILADGIRRLEKNRGKYDTLEIKKHAQRFSRERFEEDVRVFVEKALVEKEQFHSC
jgi:glycosyltransferase involved in cell wall biosynthesis